MLAFVLCPLGRVFAAMAFVLVRYQLADIFLQMVNVGASVRAPVSGARRRAHRRQRSQTNPEQEAQLQNNSGSLHDSAPFKSLSFRVRETLLW